MRCCRSAIRWAVSVRCAALHRRISSRSARYLVSDRGVLLRPHRLHGIEFPVTLFDTASALVPGNGGTDMVRASPLACSGDVLLRLAACQGKDLIAEAQ